MKIDRSLLKILIIVVIFLGFGEAGVVRGAPSDSAREETTRVTSTETGYLENILFEKLPGRERVVLMLSRQSGAVAVDQGGKTVTVKVDNLFVPNDLRRAMGEGALDNLIRVAPAQQQAPGGKPQAHIGLELRNRVPYSVRQDGHHVIVEFNVAALAIATKSGDKPAQPAPAAVTAAAPAPTPVSEQKPAAAPAPTPVSEQKPAVAPEQAPPPYVGRLVSLDFQNAGVKSVLQLLAEEGGVSIVSGEDVKGNVTVSIRKAPWEQALNTILTITGLVKKQQGNIITVMTTKKMRDDEKERKDAEKERREAEADRKKEDQALKEAEGRKRQIVIEAKIIEATDEFSRKIGVQWGTGFTDNLRVNKGSYPYGILAGASPIGATPFGAMKGLAQGTALTTANLAANFPMAAAAPAYALGLTLGSSYAVLDAEIVAAEKTSDVRIISSPKVTTMDGAKAIIKQGEEVPIVMPATAQNPATVTFKEAVLKLEVKPTITPAGQISMEVKASNDYADYARAKDLQGNPPINKSEVESKVVVSDGETMVVGGIMKSSVTKAQSGLPWVAKIPILGWLFKYDELLKNRKQLLIFITPRLVTDEAAAAGAETKPRS
jgi:type IV pilus assembly protein PilQ